MSKLQASPDLQSRNTSFKRRRDCGAPLFLHHRACCALQVVVFRRKQYHQRPPLAATATLTVNDAIAI
jgi:hypothetical protein